MWNNARNFFLALVAAPMGFAALDGIAVLPAHAACDDPAAAGVDWSECRKRNLIMSEFDFSGSNFSRADLSSSDLRGSKLSGADFEKANLVRASLKGATASGANFTSVLAWRTDLSEADFTEADFSKAETTRSDFTGSNLAGADLSKAEFSRAQFKDADISGVNFDFTNLARSDFREVRFETPPSFNNAYLYRTRIEGVDLSTAQGLASWQINLACGNSDTKLPDGVDAPVEWPCGEED